MKRSSTFIAAMLTTGLLCATSTLSRADDFAPPQYRDGPLSLRANWEFGSAPKNWNNIHPDDFAYNDMPPVFTLYAGIETHASTKFGTWNWSPDGSVEPTTADFLLFYMQNIPDIIAVTQIRIQVTWDGTMAPNVADAIGYHNELGSFSGTSIGATVIDDRHFYEDWVIPMSVQWDVLALAVPLGTSIDEVVIDQTTIPAPALLPVLGGCGLAFVGRRRRA